MEQSLQKLSAANVAYHCFLELHVTAARGVFMSKSRYAQQVDIISRIVLYNSLCNGLLSNSSYALLTKREKDNMMRGKSWLFRQLCSVSWVHLVVPWHMDLIRARCCTWTETRLCQNLRNKHWIIWIQRKKNILFVLSCQGHLSELCSAVLLLAMQC